MGNVEKVFVYRNKKDPHRGRKLVICSVRGLHLKSVETKNIPKGDGNIAYPSDSLPVYIIEIKRTP